MSDAIIEFGSFQLIPSQRLLLNAGVPLRLGSRALDILIVLASRPGEIITKDELSAAVWQGVFVEDINLRVHITSLRKALGDDPATPRYISNIPGRGYCFVAAVTPQDEPEKPAVQANSPQLRGLPAAFGRIIGRDTALSALEHQLAAQRLVTVVGPGGIGKTTIAVAAARRAKVSFRDGIVYADMTGAHDRLQVLSNLVGALGQSARSEDVLTDLIAFLSDREMLIVLDCCEHVVAAASEFAETALKGAPGLKILATSREPLKVPGEYAFRLPPLDLPIGAGPLSARNAIAYPAIQLFVDRASSVLGGYDFTDKDAPIITEICRRLDGIALAIELAAGRVDTIGIRGLAKSLDSRFDVLTKASDEVRSRHQTLREMLDWSYQILAAEEQTVFRRLSTFVGDFALDAAVAVTAPAGLTVAAVREKLNSLVSKSLVVVDVGGTEILYRLLDTTRAYGREQLASAGELEAAEQAHAEFYRGLFEQAYMDWETGKAVDWEELYSPQIGNLRAAMTWAFGPSGKAEIGIALALAAVPLLFQLSLIDECLDLVNQALANVDDDMPEADRWRMRLHAAVGFPQLHGVKTPGDGQVRGGAPAWRTALALAETLGDTDYMLRALWALWVDRTNAAEPAEALALAEQFERVAQERGETSDKILSDRLVGASHHLLGRQDVARAHIERMLSRYSPPTKRSHLVRFQYDQRVTANITLARISWFQGFPERALREISLNLAHARSIKHSLSLANILAEAACPIALSLGDLTLAQTHIEALREHTQTRALDVWNTYADAFEGQLFVKKGRLQDGLDRLLPAIDKLEDASFVLFRSCFTGALAHAYAGLGDLDRAQAAISRALALCGRSGEGWNCPELLRIKAELLLRHGAPTAAQQAESLLIDAIELADRQTARAWALRAAIALARHLNSTGRPSEARDHLAPIYGQFTEGFGTPDLMAAAALLDGRA